MDRIENKIASNYWDHKTQSASKVNITVSAKSGKTDTIVIAKRELDYFYKLTNGNIMAETTVILAVYNSLLNRYFNEELFIYSNRIGEIQCPVLYKSIVSKNKNFQIYLTEVKEEVQEVYKYANYETDVINNKNLEKFTHFGFSYNFTTSNEFYELPFFLKITKHKDGLRASVNFDANFVDSYVAKHLLDNFNKVLTTLREYVNDEVHKFSLVSSTEKEILLNSFNVTNFEVNNTDTLISLFEKQVVITPNKLALIYEDHSLTYFEVNQLANQLAHYMIETHGVLPNDFVGVKLKRSLELIVSLVAVLKTGAAYIPIDVNYPNDRIEYIEKDSQCKFTIDEIIIQNYRNHTKEYSKCNIKLCRDPESIAYVIYTSGTTGDPKGVMITHRNAVALIDWGQIEFDASIFDIVYAGTSHCFDLSVFEIFYSLSIGKSIRILNNSVEALLYLQKDKNILLNMVPSSLRSIMEAEHTFANVRVINLAGEEFPVDIAKKLMNTNAEIRNLYGPSEDTTYSTVYKLSKKVYQSIPIGKPILNTQAYVLDEQLELVPIGVEGKLFLSGSGVTKGYLNKKSQTKEKFIPDPFNKGATMYDTQDVVKWSYEGELLFLGRKDSQVKLRGYRIELGEIDAAVQAFSKNISQSVTTIKYVNSTEMIVVYFVEKDSVDLMQLKEFLVEKLPLYMIPSHFVVIKSVPLTPNGKIDINALPGLNLDSLSTTKYLAPRNKYEKKLALIWQEILGVDKVGVYDKFFELGGHSLKITRLMNVIYKEFQVKIPAGTLFQNNTMEEQSYLIQVTLNSRDGIASNFSEEIETENFSI